MTYPRSAASARRPSLTLEDLLGAPELAVLEMLAHALQVARVAVIAQYPHLLGDEYGRLRHGDDQVAQLAERLLNRACALAKTLDRYRAAIANANRADDDTELPF